MEKFIFFTFLREKIIFYFLMEKFKFIIFILLSFLLLSLFFTKT